MVADLNRVQVKVAAEENQVNWLVVGGMEGGARGEPGGPPTVPEMLFFPV